MLESVVYRETSRKTGYSYAGLHIYSNIERVMAEHNLPEYTLRNAEGAIESLAGLLNGISQAWDNSPTDKLPKTLPGVDLSAAKFGWSTELSGPMYIIDYNDYKHTMKSLSALINEFGWNVTTESYFGVPVTTYKPASTSGASELYTEDPVDAAGRALLVGALQRMGDAANITLSSGEKFAKSYARFEQRMDSGSLINFKTGIDAFTGNLGTSVACRWQSQGYPIKTIIDDHVVENSVNVVLTKLSISRQDWVCDNSSNGQLYPTKLDISMQLTNPYASLYTSQVTKK